jgi:hypothetical protein
VKYLKRFDLIKEGFSKEENLMGFKRKLSEMLDDGVVDSILELIPDSIIMPVFYRGDKAELKSGTSVIIGDTSWKNGEYIYYYELNGDEVYSYEEDFILDV